MKMMTTTTTVIAVIETIRPVKLNTKHGECRSSEILPEWALVTITSNHAVRKAALLSAVCNSMALLPAAQRHSSGLCTIERSKE